MPRPIQMSTLILMSGFSWVCSASNDFDADNNVVSRTAVVLVRFLFLAPAESNTANIRLTASETLD